MSNAATLSRNELLELIERKDNLLATNNNLLTTKDNLLATKDDIIRQLEQKNQDWELAYNKLWRERFAARSERYISNPGQLALDFGNTADASDATAGLFDALEEADLIPAHRRRKARKQRDESLPPHLPRYEVIAEVPADQQTCATHGARTVLPETMWDQTERLEFQRPVLQVRVTKYPKYACPNQPQCGVTSSERPTGIVEGDKYDTSIAAEIITAKFGYHLPIYRQQD